MEREFLEDEQAPVAYFEATYVGRPGPNGRRRPLRAPACWSAESRMRAVSLWANNALGAFGNAFASTAAQADDRPNRQVPGGVAHPSEYEMRGAEISFRAAPNCRSGIR